MTTTISGPATPPQSHSDELPGHEALSDAIERLRWAILDQDRGVDKLEAVLCAVEVALSDNTIQMEELESSIDRLTAAIDSLNNKTT